MIQVLFGALTILLVATATLEAASLTHEFGLWNATYNSFDNNSCVGRCGQGVAPDAPCQCNRPCMNFGDCCPDYQEVCNDNPITDQELYNLSEELLTLDVNNAANFVKFSIQGRGFSCTPDLASESLLRVRSGAFQLPTISKMLPLFDNYVADVNIAETVTNETLIQQNEFIDEVFATPVMRRAQAFLEQKGLPNGRADFVQKWFDFYSRGTGALGSSGFEHVFLAETRSNSVLGGHGWLFFHDQEEAGLLDYTAHRQFITSINRRGSLIELVFNWRTYCKPITSMFIGTSPELELALYTVCFYSRNNALCPVSLGGNLLHIQTYDISRNGQTFVASAYPVL